MADLTWSSVSAWEVHGTRRLSYKLDEGWTASVVLECIGSDSLALIADLIDNQQEFAPMAGFTNAPVALGAEAEPFESAADTFTGDFVYDYPYAKVRVMYGPDKGEDFISESFEPNVEFVILPFYKFNWSSNAGDQLLEAEAPGKQVYGMNLVRTYHKIDSIPTGVIDFVGHVNAASFTSDILGITFPAETLLLLPGTADRIIKTTGTFSNKLTMKFAYKQSTWNKYWRTKTSSYEYIYEKASASIYRSYPTVDMSTLLY